jgi:hypothetical protein
MKKARKERRISIMQTSYLLSDCSQSSLLYSAPSHVVSNFALSSLEVGYFHNAKIVTKFLTIPC